MTLFMPFMSVSVTVAALRKLVSTKWQVTSKQLERLEGEGPKVEVASWLRRLEEDAKLSSFPFVSLHLGSL